MALLIGYDGTGFSNNDDYYGLSGGNDHYFQTTGTATGTATTAYLYVPDWYTAGSQSVALYDASGNLLAESGTMSSGSGTGLLSAAISVSVTQSTTYYIVVFVNTGYVYRRWNSAGTANFAYNQAIGTPGSAPASVTFSGSTSTNQREFLVYLDGTIGGGGTAKPALMNSMLRRRRQG